MEAEAEREALATVVVAPAERTAEQVAVSAADAEAAVAHPASERHSGRTAVP